MNAAKKIILLLWLILAASLGNASASTPGASENRVWQKSFETLETRLGEPLQTLGGHQENEGAGYDYAVDSLLAAEETAAGGGRVFYGTPQGQLIEAPPGYQAVTAQNGNGLVLLPEGQTLGNNSSIIRWGEPSASNPDGYFRYYNSEGQPLNPATGQPGPNSATHIPPNYQGPLNGYPGR